MHRCRLFCLVLLMAVLSLSASAQSPDIFSVDDVVVGSSKTPTRYLFALGKWSDAGDDVAVMSTHIECYKRLGYCFVASANTWTRKAGVNVQGFDILRWDDKEIIAVDSGLICVVDTLRADLIKKRITLSSADKGIKNDPLCKGSDKLGTAVLLNGMEVMEREIKKRSNAGSAMNIPPQWQIDKDLHHIYQDARNHRNSYFEKLAILDGGTVALVITAVFGKLHTTIKHKYTLGVGLSFLVVAMLALLWRNYLAAKFEFHAAAATARNPQYVDNPAVAKDRARLQKEIYYIETTGVSLSAIGIVLLLIEVWLILA